MKLALLFRGHIIFYALVIWLWAAYGSDARALNYNLGSLVRKAERNANSETHSSVPIEPTIKQAEQGDRNAQNMLGAAYYGGKGVKKDIKQSLYWFEKAAEQGQDSALLNLGLIYFDGSAVGGANYKKAFSYLERSHDQGNIQAGYYIAQLYETGRGMSMKSPNKALLWYEKSANLGFDQAQLTMGNIFEKGLLNVQKDSDKAASWYEKAAKKGNLAAKVQLGIHYFNHEQYNKALALFREAEHSQVEIALDYLDQLYQLGKVGAPMGTNEKIVWYKKRAKQGDRNAQMQLYEIYTFENKPKEASYWLEEAQKNGHKRALAMLNNALPSEVNPYIIEYQEKRAKRNADINRRMNSVTGQEAQRELYRSTR